LAGPDVFLRNAVEIGERKKSLCEKYGFEGIFPIDVEADMRGISKREAGLHIGQLNESLIRTCQIVLANITPFRGPSADVGTACEIGFARGLGLIVFGYTNVRTTFVERSVEWLGTSVRRDRQKRARDANGMVLEDWDMVDNLMLESCIVSSGGSLVTHNAPSSKVFMDLKGFELCLEKIKATYPMLTSRNY